MAERLSGTVKFYNKDKNWGFIVVEGSRDVFVHKSAIGSLPYLIENQHVTFELSAPGRNGKGPSAANVEIV